MSGCLFLDEADRGSEFEFASESSASTEEDETPEGDFVDDEEDDDKLLDDGDDDYVEMTKDDGSFILEIPAPAPTTFGAAAALDKIGTTAAPAPEPILTVTPEPVIAQTLDVPAILSPEPKDVRTSLYAYGAAVARGALRRDFETSAKLENDIVEASQGVLELFDQQASELMKMQKKLNEISAEATKKDRIMEAKIKELEAAKESEIGQLKHLHSVTLREKLAMEVRSYNMDQASEAKRKSDEDAVFKALKRVKGP
jgi:hypothetical protein